MAKRSTAANSSKTDVSDLQELVTGAAQLQLSVFNAGVEYWKAVVNQTAKLTSIANDTLEEIRSDKGSVSGTTRRLAELGKDNAEVFGELSTRLGQEYFEELNRVSEAVDKKRTRTKGTKKPPSARAKPARPAPAKTSAKKRAVVARRSSATRTRTANR